MKHNTSVVTSDATARTVFACAQQRAHNIRFILDCNGVNHVVGALELCVGPSFDALTRAYADENILCWGNDIDRRWRPMQHTQQRRWIDGDAMTVASKLDPTSNIKVVVFAPPLTYGCTGRRVHALMVDEVTPRYVDFIDQLATWFKIVDVAVMVLPGRARATSDDRSQFHHLIGQLTTDYDVIDRNLVVGCTKYVDLYITRK